MFIIVDFVVFEVDIDLEKVDEIFKSWVNYVIRGLDNYIDRLEKIEILLN